MQFDRVPEIARYLSLVSFIYWLTAYTVWSFLPIYFERQMSVFWVGVLMSLPSVVPVLMDLPVGNLVQRAGEKTVIFLGFVAGVMPSLMYIAAFPVALAFGKFFEGVSKSMVWIGSWSVTMKSSDGEHESEALSVFLLGTILAYTMGPVIGGFLISSYGFQIPFMLWFGGSLLALWTFYLYIGLEGSRAFVDSINQVFHRETYKDDWKHLRQNWNSVRFPLTLLVLHSVVFSTFWLVIPLLLDQMGAEFILMGVIFGAAAVPGTFQYLFGDLGDKFGQLRTVTVLALLAIPTLIGMSITGNVFVLGALYFFSMAMVYGMLPLTHTLYDRSVPDELEGEMVGFMEMFKHSGHALGPFIGGIIASYYGLSSIFLMNASVLTLLLGIGLYKLSS